MEVVAALNSSALYRLKRTWEALPRSCRRDFDDLGELVRPDKSHAALRQVPEIAPRPSSLTSRPRPSPPTTLAAALAPHPILSPDTPRH